MINVTTAPNNTSYGESGVREEEEKGGERESGKKSESEKVCLPQQMFALQHTI